MIIAKAKDINEIADKLTGYGRILVAGCATCVAECMAGGEKETAITASALRMALRLRGCEAEVTEVTAERQCEWELIEEIAEQVEAAEVAVSLACGVGVACMADRFEPKAIIPGVNTVFLGHREKPGVWLERCAACGDCTVDRTAGICPVARCAKSLQNGPCGGSSDGKCEIDPEVDCAWHLIIERLKTMGQLDNLRENTPPKDWTSSRDGGPRKVVIEDVEE